MPKERLNLHSQLRKLNEEVQFHADDDLEGEEMYINAKKTIILMEEALTEVLSEFINAYILNEHSGYQTADGMYALHKYRLEALKNLANADTFLDLQQNLRVFVKHEAVKTVQLWLSNTLEYNGDTEGS